MASVSGAHLARPVLAGAGIMIYGSINPYRQLKRIYAVLRNLPDRTRHRSRHAAVRRKLSQMGRPKTLLVVCAGNICRSPYLEALLTRSLPDVRVASAGVVGFDRPIAAHARAVGARRGIDLSSVRSRPIQPHRARSADLVVVMEENQARYLVAYAGVSPGRIIIAGDLDPMISSTRSIEDPWKQSIDAFEATFNRLDRCAATLTRSLRRNSGKPVAVETAQPVSQLVSTRAVSAELLPQPMV